MKQKTNIIKYHDVSWSYTIAFLIGMVFYSDAVRIPVVAHSLLFSMMLMLARVQHWALSRRSLLSWLIGVSAFVIALPKIPEIKGLDDFAETMMEVIIGLLPVSLMHRDKAVSYWLSLLNTTIISIGCMLFKGDVIVYLILLGFLASTLFNLNAANMFHLTRGDPVQRRALPKGFFSQFLAAIPVGMVSGVLIFFAFPRIKSISLLLDVGVPGNFTGYTGQLDLRGGRPIEESQALSFIAISDNEEWLRQSGWNMLFRGKSLATFDGKRWLPAPTESAPYQGQDLRINRKHDRIPMSLQIFMEPTPQDDLFYSGTLVTINQLSKNAGIILVDNLGNTERSETIRARFSYNIQAFNIPDFLPQMKQHISSARKELVNNKKENPPPFLLDDQQVKLYTQLPESFTKSSWFKDWADSVVSSPDSVTISEAMRTLKLHFEKDFKASLVNQFSSAETFESFLTVDKRGHCEYFATAGALYFRHLGIPARVVLGYRGGRFNEIVKALEVREESAHAWVEIFIPGAGWTSYDPTPLAPPTATISSEFFLLSYIEAAKFWFNRYVVDYDRATQRDLIQSIQDFGYKKGSDKWSALEWLKQISTPILSVTAGIIVLMTLLKFIRFQRINSPWPEYYAAYTKLLKKKGIERNPGETLRSFHIRVRESLPENKVHDAVATAIEADLYSPDPTSASERANLMLLVRAEARAAVKRRVS